METIRRLIRKRIGYKSPLYRLAALLLTDGMTLWREGPYAYLQVIRLRRKISGAPEPVYFRSLAHPLFLRPGTSDLAAALNNIVRREYGQMQPSRPPEVLVDAGAYIGDTSVFFLNRFPSLRAYALEPNPDTLKLTRKNLSAYGARAMVIPAALSAQEGKVSFGGNQMGAQIGDDGHHIVTTTTIPALLAQIPEGRIDILKMDIEGAEHDIFCAEIGEWLPKVGLLIVETHGSHITDNLYTVLESHGCRVTQFRNLHYCQPPAGVI